MKPELELFVLRDGEGPILYAPLRRLAARLNEAAVASVSRRLQQLELSAEDRTVISLLEQHGFFTPAVPPAEDPWKKAVQVTLFPSDGCNLRCRYCYAAAAGLRHTLSPAAARAAVDYVAANAQELGNRDFVVGFHGNGEPFTNFPLIREICAYTKTVAERLGLEGKLTVASNGALDDEQLDFLLAWFNGVNISFDGLPELQDRQRPFADGRGSFDAVDRTLRRLDAAGKHYGIRSTLTTDSVERLADMAAFVAERYPHCQQLHIEPAWECGRCLASGEHTPDTEQFVAQFLAALRQLPKSGLRLVFSAARKEHLTTAFCAASRNSFVVTAEGLVTSCYEVCEATDPRAGRFIYGSYDAESGRYVFDQDKLAALHRLTVEHMPQCRDCFCKYHCAGDCPAKLLHDGDPERHSGSERCRITRAITLYQLQRSLSATGTEERDHDQ